MNYSDFPILDNSVYNLINEKYNQHKTFDRKTMVNKIYFELITCNKYCLSFSNSLNKKILTEVNTCKNTTIKLIENLKANFSIDFTNEISYKEINLFQLLNKIVNTINLFNNWLFNENKEYYKNLIKNALQDLINLLNLLISACESSFIKTFKYM